MEAPLALLAEQKPVSSNEELMLPEVNLDVLQLRQERLLLSPKVHPFSFSLVQSQKHIEFYDA